MYDNPSQIEHWRWKWGMPDTPEGLRLTQLWLEGNIWRIVWRMADPMLMGYCLAQSDSHSRMFGRVCRKMYPGE
jgi:hypothetical protein